MHLTTKTRSMAEFLELTAVDLSPALTGLELTDFYKAGFPSVARLVSWLGGSLEEAKDIFHDALIIYWEQKSKSPGKIYRSEAGYILGIAKKSLHSSISTRQKSHFSQ